MGILFSNPNQKIVKGILGIIISLSVSCNATAKMELPSGRGWRVEAQVLLIEKAGTHLIKHRKINPEQLQQLIDQVGSLIAIIGKEVLTVGASTKQMRVLIRNLTQFRKILVQILRFELDETQVLDILQGHNVFINLKGHIETLVRSLPNTEKFSDAKITREYNKIRKALIQEIKKDIEKITKIILSTGSPAKIKQWEAFVSQMMRLLHL